MFKVGAGLGSLGVALGLATTFALTANAAPPDGGDGTAAGAGRRRSAEPGGGQASRAARSGDQAGTRRQGDRCRTSQGSKVVKLGKAAPEPGAPAEDQYVELAREKTDKIFVVLAEFGDERAPELPGPGHRPEHPGAGDVQRPAAQRDPGAGPDEGQLDGLAAGLQPRPLPAALLRHRPGGESLKTYYERQSSGRYSVDGQVTDWVKVRYNEARYGRSDGYPCAGNVCSNTWDLIQDAIDTWVADQHAAGRTDAQIKADLASYDQWDRNDYDHDGNFNEPDGYIDHFQIVHAGGDQADGDPHQGEDAIWSHRWKAFQNTGQGPAGNKDGGTQIGTTGLWVADYTIQPENGGLSVFAHEYGHDLGLPDHYDTAAAADNAVNWWTLMAQSRDVRRRATRASARAPPTSARGTSCSSAGSTTRSCVAGQNKTLDLGPHECNTAKAQGVVVVLPQKTVTTALGAPAAGTKQWYSGTGDDYEATLARQVARAERARPRCPSRRAGTSRTAGRTRATTRTSRSTTARATRRSRARSPSPPRATASTASAAATSRPRSTCRPTPTRRSRCASTTRPTRRRRATTGATEPPGIFVDEIKLTNGTQTLFTDGAENGANGWAATASPSSARRRRSSTTTTTSPPTGRTPRTTATCRPGRTTSASRTGRTGSSTSRTRTACSSPTGTPRSRDNNESQHPGQGEVLPIDANPSAIYRLDGKPWRGRIQTYDAPFGLEKSDSFTLHAQETGRRVLHPRAGGAAAVRRPARVLGPGAAVRRRQGPARGRDDPRPQQSGTSMRIRIGSTAAGT